MLTHNASTLALGILCFASLGLGCGGSGVSLGNDGQGGNSGATPGAGGALANAGVPGTGGANDIAGAPSSGGANDTAGAPSTAGATNNAGAGGASSSSCQDPVALGGGWERCKNGLVHRPTPGKCVYTPRTTGLPTGGPADQCTKDSQCTAMPNGYCTYVSRNTAAPNSNVCAYGCLTDADCDAGNVCQCGASAGAGVCGHTVPTCKSDADCNGALCTNYDSAPGCMIETFACQTPADQCETDSDCPATNTAMVCSLSGTHRVCAPLSCAF